MKKFITIITAVILLAVLITGCGSGTGSNESAMDTNGQIADDKSPAGEEPVSDAVEDVSAVDGSKDTEAAADISAADNSTADTSTADSSAEDNSQNTDAAGDPKVITASDDTEKEIPNVYMTTNISPDGLMAVYKALGRTADGKVAIKLHMGEPGGHNFLSPDLVKDFVQSLDGTFVDCNTAYGGRRATTAMHMQAAEDHGFAAVAPVDIMDADDTISLPIKNGKHLKEDVVGSHYQNYDFYVILSHFKGHEMGGFGGAIKNMSIGIASVKGKNLIHTAGKSSSSMWGGIQDNFLESMAEAAKAVADDRGERILYINVMNNLSIDCDCNGYPAKPDMADIGILASLDPVALDKACVDLVYAAPDGQSLIRRMEAKNGIHTLEYAEEIGLGSQKYNLVKLDD
jgi:hypothetical protein